MAVGESRFYTGFAKLDALAPAWYTLGTPVGQRSRCWPWHNRCGVEQWQLVGLITRRSVVRIHSPLYGIGYGLVTCRLRARILFRYVCGCCRSGQNTSFQILGDC